MALSNSGAGSSSICDWNDDWDWDWNDNWWEDVDPNDFWGDEPPQGPWVNQIPSDWFHYLYPPTYEELTDRYKDSFEIFHQYIIAFSENLADDPSSLPLIMNEISNYPFGSLLVDTLGQTKLELRSVYIGLVDGPSNSPTIIDTLLLDFIPPSGQIPMFDDGTVNNPGLPDTQSRVIKIEIKNTTTGTPTGNYFWVSVWLQVAPPN